MLSALAIASALTGGCGGDRAADSGTSTPPDGSSSSAATIDPCALVTKAEADQALGAEATQERPSEANIPPRLVTCRYTAPRGQALAVMTVMVRIGYSDSEARTGFQGTRQLGNTEPVAGLGDDAFWLMNQLYVLKGTRQLTISGDVSKEQVQQLARQAVARLQ
jgi:hypothetical protein